jgi:large subunit ribosomal protein L15
VVRGSLSSGSSKASIISAIAVPTHAQATMVRTIILAALVAAASAFSSFTPRNLPTHAATRSSNLSMKIYDWKRRTADESAIHESEFTLDNLRSAPGSRKRKSRKGRGISAGQGATCGFGMRGQKSRAGRPTRPGFEGGQQPLYRRLPKFPGQPTGPGHEKEVYNLIKLDELNGAVEGATINFDSLLVSGATTKAKHPIHKIVVGRQEFTAKGVTVQAHAFTQSARDAIEGAGGKCELLSKTTNAVLVEA